METKTKRLRRLEQDLIVQFSNDLQRQFLQKSVQNDRVFRTYSGSAIGAQDRELADYLLAVNARFALIEFKADEDNIKSEKSKLLRVALCTVLASDSAMLARAREMHFVAWGQLEHQNIFGVCNPQLISEIVMASYADKVCSTIDCAFPVAKINAIASSKFINSFLEFKTKGGPWKRFKRYLEELYLLAKKDTAGALSEFQGSVYVFVPSSAAKPAQVMSVRFSGLQHLFDLTIHLEKHLQKKSMQRNLKLTPNKSDHGISM